MGNFYEKVLKMRENGTPIKKVVRPKEVPKQPKEEVKKPIETVVKKNDKGTGGKS